MSQSTSFVALVGCGGWGKNHARALHRLGALGVLCDADPKKVAELSAAYPGVPTSTDLDAVLQNPAIRGVVLATPSPTHAKLTLKALRAGKDVMVEKPMALSTQEGAELVQEAEKLGRILMVGHVLEFHPAILKLRELIQEGALGKVFNIQSNRLNLGRIRTEENALWSFAPHDVALILRLFGDSPERVACHGEAFVSDKVADTTLTHLDFGNKRQAHIFVSWLHPFKEHKLVVVGSRQMAVFNDVLGWEEKLVLYPHQVEIGEGKAPVANRADGVPVVLAAEEPLTAELRHFIECIETRNRPLTDGKSGLEVLKVLQAAQRSLENHGVPQMMSTQETTKYFSHASAIVHPKADIGEGTRIWHHSHVMEGSRIGRDCILGQNVFVAKNAIVGNRVKVQNNVSLYEGVVLEDGVFCGPSMVFTNVMNPRAKIEKKNEFRKTLVREGATLGANCTIVCGNEIGRFAFVGAGSVVTRNVPDYTLVVGSPAKAIGHVCECGDYSLKFGETGTAECAVCASRYELSDEGVVRCVRSTYNDKEKVTDNESAPTRPQASI